MSTALLESTETQDDRWAIEFALTPSHAGMAVEYAVTLQPESRVDESNGVIRDVRIVGVHSRNTGRVLGLREQDFGAAVDQPYSYTMEALRNAIPMYEGAKVFVDHSEFDFDSSGRRVAKRSARQSKDLIGRLQNVRAVEGEGLRGDFYYLKSDALAPKLVEIAQRMPDLMAMSHEAGFANPQLQNGRIHLTEITDVDFVALVSTKPGTTNGLFEDYQPRNAAVEKSMLVTTLSELAESVDKDTDGLALLLEMCSHEMAGGQHPPVGGINLEIPKANEMSDGDKVKAGLIAAISEYLSRADVSRLQAVANALGVNQQAEQAAPNQQQAPPAPPTAPAPPVPPQHQAAEGEATGAGSEGEGKAVEQEDQSQSEVQGGEGAQASGEVSEEAVDPRASVFECMSILREAGVTDIDEVSIKAMESLSQEDRVAFAERLRPQVVEMVARSQSPAPKKKKEAEASDTKEKFKENGSLIESMNQRSGAIVTG